ncbi:MAG TPA: LysR family transcriptional regulator [Candidatus Lachnoclostridium pullistercoris]|uniref:LysR family transcriptional regulator n=1 Tax=Candidatus Lachnoclostridium pullistercoris TaxID=2838632 RepID=A0A9D2PDS7_9FIRM|nr:LysR family transcriptional regulator [Candidatus Lachnoclostridium pullistercoris]
MDVEKCRTFLAAAENDTFTAAADQLYMTTANVTKHIAALERELGFALFERKSRGIQLTEEGKKCVPYAAQIVQASSAMQGLKKKKLKLCSIPCQQKIGLPDLLHNFKLKYPKVELDLKEYHGLKLLKMLLNEECELGFLGDLYCKGKELDEIEIFGENMCAILPKNHRYAGKRKISLNKLKDENFVFLAPESGMYRIYKDMCRDSGFEPKVVLSVSREDTMLSYIQNQMGVSLCGKSILSEKTEKRVTAVELEEEYRSGCVLAKKRGKKLSENAALFWCFVKNEFKGN